MFRNADSLISRLPTELITMILQFAVLLGPRTSLYSGLLDHGGGSGYYKELSVIRQVCKKWQAIVESNSTFWFYVSSSLPPRLFRKIIEHPSGKRSLFVEHSANTSLGDGKDYVPAILRQSESWTSLHVRYTNHSQLLQLLEQPIPRLRKIHVEYSGTAGTFEISKTGLQTVSLPPLEILRMKDSIFPWRWSAVRDLLVIDVDCHDLCPYFSQGFVDALRSSPRLESLTLRSCRTDFQPHLKLVPIPLQRVVSLDFKFSPAAAALLEAITCPPSTNISICDKARSLATQDPRVTAAVSHTNFECTDRVCLKLRPNTMVGVIVGNIDLEMRRLREPFQPTAMLQFYTRFLKPFSETNGAQVKALEIELELTCDIAPFMNILDSYFPNITSLVFRCCFYGGINTSDPFDVLAKPIEENGKRRWLLPWIEKLVLEAGFGHGRLAKSIIEVIRSRYSSQASVQTTEASINSEAPTPLKELHIRNYAMLKSEADELKNILGDAVKFEDVVFRKVRYLIRRVRFGSLIEPFQL
ncbi:hypothetical protein FRC01_002960 [Tulasnella sp. 417]|nr:hypothetical protein FRC01_002960 [Tulasnella sp. 417]